ncbi:MAG TPA: hypothetical protein VJ276_11145 [Thermoanaerobaculia bacterium]|nr:hypothetical protein [Thermoanaerobaculia bacterium]
MRAAVRSVLLLLIVFCLLPLQAAPPPGTMILTFNGSTLHLTNVTAGGSVFIYGLAREGKGDHVAVVEHAMTLVDDDGNGVIDWVSPAPFPERSVWFAADLMGGKYAVNNPSVDYETFSIDLPASSFAPNTGGQSLITSPGYVVECVVVRPNVGVWHQEVISEGALDTDQVDGQITIAVGSLEPVGDTLDPAPSTLEAGDIVFMMDSANATYTVGKVGA